MTSGPALYQASGSRLMISSAGLEVWPKKNQCHHAPANRASARASASPIGIESSTASAVTASGWSIAVRNAT